MPGPAFTVLLEARLAARGLGIGAFVERLLAGFEAGGLRVPDLWVARTEPGRSAVLSTLLRSGLFDLSPRLDPRSRYRRVVHFAGNVGSVMPGANSVLTVHDLLHRRHLRGRDRVLGALLERCLPRAGRVVAVSARTRREIEEAFPQLRGQVQVIPHGLRRIPGPSGRRTHLLAFGGTDPRKRVDLLVEIYRRYGSTTRDPLPLVLLARAGLTPSQRAALTGLGARIVDSASRAEVDALMAGAAALVYPTTDEGFGLPVLEAAEASTPVVVDRAARVAEEMIGPHCVLVDDTGVDSWVTGLQHAIDGGPVPNALNLPDWASVAGAYQDLYEQVA